MEKNTQDIWDSLKESLFYFILKRVKNEDTSNDILQDVFIKIHLNLNNVKDPSKIPAWVFQITRNQINEHFRKSEHFTSLHEVNEQELLDEFEDYNSDFCCFETFIDELPDKYSKVIALTSLKGKKQKEVANQLQISLSSIKSRIHRAKNMLKQKFIDCCQFTLNEHGLLEGEQNCTHCTCTNH